MTIEMMIAMALVLGGVSAPATHHPRAWDRAAKTRTYRRASMAHWHGAEGTKVGWERKHTCTVSGGTYRARQHDLMDGYDDQCAIYPTLDRSSCMSCTNGVCACTLRA